MALVAERSAAPEISQTAERIVRRWHACGSYYFLGHEPPPQEQSPTPEAFLEDSAPLPISAGKSPDRPGPRSPPGLVLSRRPR